jgi:uncharacterized protein YoxC
MDEVNDKVIAQDGKEEAKRTETQNNSLHRFCRELANDLNEKGLTVQFVISHSMDIDWSMQSVKDLLWRTAQKGHLGKVSSTELNTKEVSPIYEEVNRIVTQFGVSIPWPSLDEQANSQLTK